MTTSPEEPGDGDASRDARSDSERAGGDGGGASPGGPLRSGGEEVHEAIETALRDLWRVVDDLASVPAPTEYYRVTIFGSSRMDRGDELYGDVRRLARELSSRGCDIVTGGGPGLMEAANEGERRGDASDRTRSYGLNVELPHEQKTNPFVEEAHMHRSFFTRLHHFVRLSSAFVVVPGGIGTTLEAMMVWQLCQVRHIHDRPLVFVGEMWGDLLEWARRHMLDGGPAGDRPLADPKDLEIPQCAAGVDEAVALIAEDLEEWQEARDGVDDASRSA